MKLKMLTAILSLLLTIAVTGSAIAQFGPLPSGQIYVGDASNQAAAVPLSGDATLSNTGALTVIDLAGVTNGSLANSGLVNSSVTINSVSCVLGGTCSITAAASSISNATTVTGSISVGEVLFSNGGNVGGLGSTGTGDVVRKTAPSVSDLTITGSLTATGLVGNSALVNSSTTVNGQVCTLGSSCTVVTGEIVAGVTGTNITGTTNVNGLLYNANGNRVTNLPTGNNGVLVTNGSGVPSVSGVLPAVSGAAVTNLPAANAGTAGGAANAMTATLSSHSTIVSGQVFTVIASAPNTSVTPTLALTLSGGGTVGPFVLTKFGGQALLPHDVFASGHRLQVIYTGTGFELLNPAISPAADAINADNLGIGTADDTSIWDLIDAQIGTNASLPKTVWVTKQTNVKRFNITNIRKFDGIKNLQTFTLAATGGVSDWVLRYIGSGPFTFENQTIVCPIYDPVTRVQPAGFAALLVQPASSAQQNSFVNVKHVRTVGCSSGIIIYQSGYTVLEDIFNDRPFGNGWVISDALDQASTHTRHIRVRDVYGVNAGEYCGSLPVVQTASTLTPVDIVVQNAGCDGAGFIGSKFCFDLTGSAFTSVRFEGWGRNCRAGGMEIKSGNNNAALVPNNVRAIDVQFRYDSNYDGGIGVWWAREAPGAGPDLYSQVRGRNFVTFKLPDARQASTRYEAGAVFQANGNTYKVVTPGTTDATSGPSGTGNGITDGTAQVDYLQATPATPSGISAGAIEAITDADLEYTFYGLGNGIILYGRGSSDSVQRRVNLKMTGWVERYCLQDVAFVPPGVFDNLTVSGSCRSAGSGGFSLMAFGLSYTNFNLTGGPWVNASGTGVIRVGPSGSLSGTIAGGVHLVGDTGLIYNEGTLNLTVGGGGVWEIKNASSRAAVYSTGAAANGTVNVNQVNLVTAASGASAAYDSWGNFSGATTNVYGRFIRGYKSSTPTEHCNSGDIFWSQTPGVGGQPSQGWYCSTPGTTWSSISGTIGAATGTSLVVSAQLSAGTHFLSTSSVPAASTCGTSPTVTANSTNHAGSFMTGTGTPTACTLTFASAFPTAAFCSVTPTNAAAVGTTVQISASSASAFTVTLGVGANNAAYNYTCMGR